MNKRLFSVYDGLILAILIYTVSTMTHTLMPSFLPLNKIIGFIIYILIAWLYCVTLKKRDVIVVGCVLITIISAIYNDISSESIDHIQYFTIVILFINKLIDDRIRIKLKESLKKYENVNNIIITSLGVLTLITFFISNCYINNGDEIVLKGFCPHSHTFCSCMCLLMSLNLFYMMDKEIKIINIIKFVPFLFGIFEGGARTFLISAIVILFVFYILKLRNYPLKPLLLIGGGIVLVYLFMNSSVLNRFLNTENNTYISDNPLEAASSGRLIWWRYDLEAFNEFPIIQKIFGAGYKLVFDINENRYGRRIWAHNDFIQLLVSIGVFGLLTYINLIISWIKALVVKSNKNILKIAFGTYIIFTAFINGFYISQHYFFSAIIFMLAIETFFARGEKNEQAKA